MWADYKCNNCKEVFEIKKEFGKDFPKHPKCINCDSEDVNRCYNEMYFTFPEGNSGAASNGYTSIKNKQNNL